MIALLFLCLFLVTLSKGTNNYPGTETDPVLSETEATTLTLEKYLSPWVPEKIALPEVFDYVVTSSIQATINEAISHSANNASLRGKRLYILVPAGTYEETVFIPDGAPPLTISGAIDSNGDSTTQIHLDLGANMTTNEWTSVVNPNGTRYREGDPAYSMYEDCAKSSGVLGTHCTAVVWLRSDDIQLVDVRVYNRGVAQAVALRSDSDRVHLERVFLGGYQDTVYLKSGLVFVNDSHIEGDTDYVCGSAIAVFLGCDFYTVSERKKHGIIFAPRTAPDESYGFLVERSSIRAAEEYSNTTNVVLGRSWDDTDYVPDRSANGQLLIRDSVICDIVNSTAPWGTGINSKRAFSGNIDPKRNLNDNRYNRFWEYNNIRGEC